MRTFVPYSIRLQNLARIDCKLIIFFEHGCKQRILKKSDFSQKLRFCQLIDDSFNHTNSFFHGSLKPSKLYGKYPLKPGYQKLPDPLCRVLIKIQLKIS